MGTTVCVGGLIAAGKTTLIGKLSDRCAMRELRSRIMPELFPDAVRSMVHKNLAVEDAFLFAHRLQMAMDAPDLAKLYDVVLMERSFIDHLAFAEAFGVCKRLPQYLADWPAQVVQEVAPPKPDRYLFLNVSPEVSCERREQRGTAGDGVFTLEFMRALNNAYERLIPLYYDDPIILDWSDFGSDLCLDELLAQLAKMPVKT